MAGKALFCYRGRMRDFIEIMSFCGYDMQRAHAMAAEYAAVIEEELERVSLEALEPKSVREEHRRLCGEGDSRSAWR